MGESTMTTKLNLTPMAILDHAANTYSKAYAIAKVFQEAAQLLEESLGACDEALYQSAKCSLNDKVTIEQAAEYNDAAHTALRILSGKIKEANNLALDYIQ
jgi:hypothetical protein